MYILSGIGVAFIDYPSSTNIGVILALHSTAQETDLVLICSILVDRPFV